LLDPGSVFFGFPDFAPKGAGPLGVPPAVAFSCRPALGELAFPSVFDQCDEPIKSQLTVAILRAGFLDCHRKSRRPMNKGNGGGDLVNMLAARAA
jgi:hypothetical protein